MKKFMRKALCISMNLFGAFLVSWGYCVTKINPSATLVEGVAVATGFGLMIASVILSTRSEVKSDEV